MTTLPTAPTSVDGSPRRYVLEILQPDQTDGEIDLGMLHWLDGELARAGVGQDRVEVDIWLNSPGGNAHAAYRIALLLDSRVDRLRVVVPDSARSAATLLALSADEIYLADAAELGPLDAQIEHSGVTASARDVVRNLEYLQQQAILIAERTARGFRDVFGITSAEALGLALPFAASLQQPLIGRTDLAQVFEAKNALEVTERYARRLLGLRHARELRRGEHSDTVPWDAFERAVLRLVRGYPTHDFVIDRAEAEELGLPVRALDEYADAAEARAALDDVRRIGTDHRGLRLASQPADAANGDGGPAGGGQGRPRSGRPPVSYLPLPQSTHEDDDPGPSVSVRPRSIRRGRHAAPPVTTPPLPRRQFIMRDPPRRDMVRTAGGKDELLHYVRELTFADAPGSPKEAGKPWKWPHDDSPC